MSIFENRTGISITNNKLQVVGLDFNGEEFILKSIDEVYFDEPLILKSNKETKILSVLQNAYNELIIKCPLNTNKVAFTLPLDLFYIHQLPYDKSLLSHDLLEEFKWEFFVLYPHVKFEEFVFQFYEVSKNNFNTNNTAIAAAIHRKYLNTIQTFCSRNNLEIKFLDNSHFAFDRAIKFANPLFSAGLILSVYLIENNLAVEYLLNGKPFFYKLLHFASIDEVPKILSELTKPSLELKIGKIQLSAAFIGGEELSVSFIHSLENMIGIKFNLANPFGNLKTEKAVLSSNFFLEKAFTFSSAAGISYRLA